MYIVYSILYNYSICGLAKNIDKKIKVVNRFVKDNFYWILIILKCVKNFSKNDKYPIFSVEFNSKVSNYLKKFTRRYNH